jgi:hypothetical protein
MGRPKVEINWEEFDKLCLIQCTEREIACWFNCSVDTIERRLKSEHNKTFAEYWEEKAGRGKMAVRRKQYELAVSGSIPMLIWWGKNNLGQAERVEEKAVITHHEGESKKTQELVDLISKMLDDLQGCQTLSSTPSSEVELGLLPPSSQLQ